MSAYLTPYILSFMAVALAFAAISFLIGRVLSARIAGPIHAFELYLRDLEAGRIRPLRLRTGDEFKKLEDMAARITEQVTKARSAQGLSPIETLTEK